MVISLVERLEQDVFMCTRRYQISEAEMKRQEEALHEMKAMLDDQERAITQQDL